MADEDKRTHEADVDWDDEPQESIDWAADPDDDAGVRDGRSRDPEDDLDDEELPLDDDFLEEPEFAQDDEYEEDDSYEEAESYQQQSNPGAASYIVPGAIAVLTALLLVAIYMGDARLVELEANASRAPAPAAQVIAAESDYAALDHSHSTADLEALASEVRELRRNLVELEQRIQEQPQPAPVEAPETVASTASVGDQVNNTAAGFKPLWYLNLSSFAEKARANAWLESHGGAASGLSVIEAASGSRRIYRVRMGPFDTRAEAVDQIPVVAARWSVEGAWVQVE